MNKLIISFLFIITFMSVNYVTAQSKKEIRENKIATETATITVIENGKELSFKDSYVVYDKNGNEIEQIEYNRDGSIKSKHTNKYDSNKNKIESTEYNDKDKKTIKTTYVYNGNDEKVLEIEYDSNGKIIKQTAYIYNNKGFRTERRVVDGNKKLVSVKKYVYTAR